MAKKKPGSNGCVLLFFLVLCLLGGLFIRSTPPKWVEDRGTVTEILAKPGSTDVKVSYTYRAQRPHSRSGYTTYDDSEVIPRARYPMLHAGGSIPIYYDENRPYSSTVGTLESKTMEGSFRQYVSDNLKEFAIYVLLPMILAGLGLGATAKKRRSSK